MIEQAHKDALRERATSAAQLQEANDTITQLRASIAEERNKSAKVPATTPFRRPPPNPPQLPRVFSQATTEERPFFSRGFISEKTKKNI